MARARRGGMKMVVYECECGYRTTEYLGEYALCPECERSDSFSLLRHSPTPWGVSLFLNDSTLIGSNMLSTIKIFEGNTGVSPRNEGPAIALVYDNPDQRTT